jgi:aspartate-semialdehyde dehydrogenase
VQANLPVFSNAKNHRHDPHVPLIVPTINLSHMELLPHQRKLHGISKGFLICNSNCSLVGIAVPFAALQNAFGPIECASVVTMQAISGGGYPGVPSMEILDNVVPYIDGEEEKIQVEARKVLGSIDFKTMTVAEQSQLRISAACNRVAVMDGHLACVSLRFERKPPNMKCVKEALATYISRAQTLGCPSAPSNAIVLMEELDRPQPRLDRDMQNGFTVSVGRLREDESGIFDLKFVSLSHNSKSSSED